MKFHVLSVALISISLFSGCATILNEDVQKINITSSNAKPIEGTIDGAPFSGPGIVEVKRANKDQLVTVTTPNCTKDTLLAKQVDSKFFINVLSGGAFGSTTDYSSEKMWKYDDSVVIQCN